MAGERMSREMPVLSSFTNILPGFDQPESYSRCRVEFGNPTATKRSLGKFHEWDVLSIEYLDDKEPSV